MLKENGDWQFLCGTTDVPAHCRLICLKDIVERASSVNDIADLPRGSRAWHERIDTEWRCEAEISEE